jgi:hypothetical protein
MKSSSTQPNATPVPTEGMSTPAPPAPILNLKKRRKKPSITIISIILLLALVGIVSAIAIPALLGQRARMKKGSEYAELLDKLNPSSSVAGSGSGQPVDWAFLNKNDSAALEKALLPGRDQDAPAVLDIDLRRKILARLTPNEIITMKHGIRPLPNTNLWQTNRAAAARIIDRSCDFLLARKVVDKLDEIKFCTAAHNIFFLNYASKLNVRKEYADEAVTDMEQISNIVKQLESGSQSASPAQTTEFEEALVSLRKQQAVPVRILKELADSLPDNLGFRKVNIKGNTVFLEGDARNIETLNVFQENLRARSRCFRTISDPNVKPGPGGNVEFMTTFTFQEDNPEKTYGEIARQEGRLAGLIAIMPSEPDYGELPYRIKKISDEAGIDQQSFSLKPEQPGPFYKEKSVEFAFRAGFQTFGQFASLFSGYEKIINFKEIDISRAVGGPSPYTVSVKCTISAFILNPGSSPTDPARNQGMQSQGSTGQTGNSLVTRIFSFDPIIHRDPFSPLPTGNSAEGKSGLDPGPVPHAGNPPRPEDSEPARLLVQAPLIYPQRALQTRWEMDKAHTVRLKVFVGDAGQALKVSVIEGVPGEHGFNEAAIEAANKSTYRSATRLGKSVRGWTPELTFTIPARGR